MASKRQQQHSHHLHWQSLMAAAVAGQPVKTAIFSPFNHKLLWPPKPCIFYSLENKVFVVVVVVIFFQLIELFPTNTILAICKILLFGLLFAPWPVGWLQASHCNAAVMGGGEEMFAIFLFFFFFRFFVFKPLPSLRYWITTNVIKNFLFAIFFQYFYWIINNTATQFFP